MRTDLQRLGVNYLQGVREVAPKISSRTDEIHGLWDYHAGSLRRLDGKLLNSTGGSIWGIHQLRFRGRRAVVIRDNSSIIGIDDLDPLPGIVFPDPGFPDDWNVLNGGWGLPNDWPDQQKPNNPIGPGSPPGGDNPAGPTGDDESDNVDMWLIPIPTFIEFDTNIHGNGATQLVSIKKIDATNGSGSAVKVSWNSGIEWMSLRYLGPASVQSLSSGSIFPLGAWNSLDVNDIKLSVGIAPTVLNGVPGTYIKTLTFEVVDFGGNIPSGGTTSCVVGVKLIARPPEINVVTGDPAWHVAVKDSL